MSSLLEEDKTLTTAQMKFIKMIMSSGKLLKKVVDDVLDFEGDLSSLGKPSLSDLKSGLSTAPVLFAAEMFPELDAMMERKFKEAGDVERAEQRVNQSDGIGRTKHLARVHAEIAMEAALQFSPSLYRDALINLARKIVRRTS